MESVGDARTIKTITQGLNANRVIWRITSAQASQTTSKAVFYTCGVVESATLKAAPHAGTSAQVAER